MLNYTSNCFHKIGIVPWALFLVYLKTIVQYTLNKQVTFDTSAILYMNTNCVSVRPSDDVLAVFSVAEPATENYLSYFVLSKAGRPGQPLGGD